MVARVPPKAITVFGEFVKLFLQQSYNPVGGNGMIFRPGGGNRRVLGAGLRGIDKMQGESGKIRRNPLIRTVRKAYDKLNCR